MNERQTQAANEMYDRYVQSWKLVAQYRYVIAEFTPGTFCTGCLHNAIMGLLRTRQAVNANTVLTAYKNEVHTDE